MNRALLKFLFEGEGVNPPQTSIGLGGIMSQYLDDPPVEKPEDDINDPGS